MDTLVTVVVEFYMDTSGTAEVGFYMDTLVTAVVDFCMPGHFGPGAQAAKQ